MVSSNMVLSAAHWSKLRQGTFTRTARLHDNDLSVAEKQLHRLSGSIIATRVLEGSGGPGLICN